MVRCEIISCNLVGYSVEYPSKLKLNKPTEALSMMYTVWVGGVEVADYFVRREDAEDIAEVWRNIGHTDVAIEEVSIDFSWT